MNIILNRFYQIVPILLSSILILVSAANDGTIIHYSFIPSMAAICVFYWVFTYPDLIGSLTVFMVGMVSDCIFLQPLGLDSFSLLIAYMLTSHQRDDVVKYGFFVVWGFFAYFMLIYYLVKMMIAYIYVGQIFFDFNLVIQFVLTYLCYPVCHRVLALIRFKKIISLRI